MNQLFHKPAISLKIVIMLWVLVACTMMIIIAPNTDDVSYYLSALSYTANGHMGVPMGGHRFEYVFYNLPTMAFIESGFYKLMTWCAIPLNFYTYRIPILLFFIAGILLSFRFLTYTDSYSKTRQIVFCGLLGVTLFAQTWILNRPEVVGIVFLMGHLLSYLKWRDHIDSRGLALLSGLCLGMLPALHPQFIPVAIGLFVVDTLFVSRSKEWRHYLLFLLPMMLPGLLVIAYFDHHAPYSWQVLHAQTQGAAQHSSWFRTFKIMFANAFGYAEVKSHLLRIINVIFYLPTLLMLAFNLIALMLKAFRKRWAMLDYYAAAFTLSAVFILAKSWGSPYTIAICSFYIVISFAILLNENATIRLTQIFSKYRWCATVALILLIGFYAIINIAKFTLTKNRYLLPSDVITKVSQIMVEQRIPLFVMKTQYVPLFTQQLYAQYSNLHQPQNVYWLLPSSGQIVELSRDRRWGFHYVSDVLKNHKDILIFTYHPTIHSQKVTIPLSRSQLVLTGDIDAILYNINGAVVLKAHNIALTTRHH